MGIPQTHKISQKCSVRSTLELLHKLTSQFDCIRYCNTLTRIISWRSSRLDGGVACDDGRVDSCRYLVADADVVQHSNCSHQATRLLGRVQQCAATLVKAAEARFEQPKAAFDHRSCLAVSVIVGHF